MTSLYEACELPTASFQTQCGRGSLDLIDGHALMDAMTHLGRTLHLPGMNGKHEGPLAHMVHDLTATGYKVVLDRAGVMSGAGGLLGPDHLFSNLLKNGMVLDNSVLMSQGSPAEGAAAWSAVTVVVAYQLGTNVCGHPGIVHGGLSAAMIDESLGYLLYLNRHAGALAFERVLTARMEVDYRAPVLPNTAAVVTARVGSVEGKKVWVEAVLADQPLTADQMTAAVAPRTARSTPAAGEPKVAATARALFIAQGTLAPVAAAAPAKSEPASAEAAAGAAAPSPVAKQGSNVSDEGTPADV